MLRQYTVFTGRSRRQEFWMFTLISFLASLACVIVGRIIGVGDTLNLLYSLAVLLPTIGVGIRRLHDTNRTGWWLLLGLIPIVGLIVLIIFMAQDGNSGENQYGADPKAA
ncbi:MAG: DUF805 domain-containing protein [Sulfurospirillaceae bacterium]|nr:DUF805 domain-containing protein [Sulfurospirillaceae bacterium]